MSRDKLFHPATLISLIALFVSLGGIGYAATRIGTKQIKNGAVTGKKLARNSVTSAKIKSGAVGNSDLATNSVSTGKIRNNAIIAGKLASSSVLSDKLADGAVTAGKLGNGAVTAGKLAAGSVTGAAIAPGSIGATQIADGQVVKGSGTLMNRETTLTNGQNDQPVLTFPGLGTLQADCAAGVATVEFANTSGTSIDVRVWGVINGAPDTATIDSLNPSNGQVVQQSTAPNGIAGITWMASFRDTAGLHLVTVNTSTKNLGGTSCPISAQGLFTSGL
jgi:hypothetical protein